MQKISAFILMVCLVLSNVVSVSASDTKSYTNLEDVPAPRMAYISNASGTIYIDNSGTATVKASVNGYQGITTKVTISAKLQRYRSGNWETIKTYSASSDSHRVSLTEYRQIDKGYAYRVQANITAYSGSKTESQTVTSSQSQY